MSHNMHSNAALHPIYPPPPTALPLDWDEELPEIIQNPRRRGGFDLLSCKPNTGNVLYLASNNYFTIYPLLLHIH